jgi:type IV pilus assembly protein PilQ
MQAHNESNTVIVSDTPEKIKIINDLVQQIDVPEKQVMIEARLVDMTEAASRRPGHRVGDPQREGQRPAAS